MFKYANFILLLLIILSPAPSYAHGETLIVSGQMNWKPFLMRNATSGETYGAMYDILKTAANANGCKLKYIDYPWQRAVTSLEKGRIDVICGIFWNKQRAKKFNFSIPIIKNELRIFTSTPFAMEKISDLKGKSGDYIRGGSYGKIVDNFIRSGMANFNDVTNDDIAISRQIRRYSDFFIGTYVDTTLKLNERGLTEIIKPLPYIVDRVDVFFAFTKGAKNKYLYERIKNTLKEMQSNGTNAKILHSYLQKASIELEHVLIKKQGLRLR